ncbi:MAG: F-type H+-transporting ATPase subunit gamma [Candidatus Parcubacteria bacterium]|jgi:F-type H+-transporting ATPase subunit gamma|nr:F-type H+-transporting ATPase subunit gamma [Candidatus Parcubacteria bacterium]
MALKDIKTKIGATKRMHTVTRAMEAVSAVKMRKTQGKAFEGRPYARAALSVLTRLTGSKGLSQDPLAIVRPVKKTALVVITSDKGLAGALNSGVIRAAELALRGRSAKDVLVYAIGRKGEEYFRRRDYRILRSEENKSDDVSLPLMEEFANELSNGFRNGEFDEVVCVYSNFRSTFEQVSTARTLLPLTLDTLAELVRDIRPAKGKWSDEPLLEAPSSYDTDAEAGARHDVLEVLVPRLVAVSLYYMLLEAKASEHSARMVAMKSASDKSKEVARDLTRVYNKVRQAAITREVSEIVGGREALAT